MDKTNMAHVFHRPLVLVEMGEVGQMVQDQVFDRAKLFGHGRPLFHVAFASLRKIQDVGDTIDLRFVCPAATSKLAWKPEAKLSDLLAGAARSYALPAQEQADEILQLGRRLADFAAQLSSTDRVEAAAREGLPFREARAEIVLLIDHTDDPRWWSWACQLGRQLLRPGHRVLAFLRFNWADLDDSPVQFMHKIQHDLIGHEPSFSQLYLIGNRNQRNSAIDGGQQATMIADYLLDRIWPASAERFESTIDRHNWVDAADIPAAHFWSFAYRTIRYDSDELLAQLRARDYRLEFGDPEWTNTDPNSEDLRANYQQSPPEFGGDSSEPAGASRSTFFSNHLVSVARAVMTPHPGSRLGRRRNKESVHWPPIDAAAVTAHVENYERRLWEQVEEELLRKSKVPNLRAAHEQLVHAFDEIERITSRQKINAVKADRAVKQDNLDGPFDVKSKSEQALQPRFLMATIVAALAVLWVALNGVTAALTADWFLGSVAILWLVVALTISLIGFRRKPLEQDGKQWRRAQQTGSTPSERSQRDPLNFGDVLAIAASLIASGLAWGFLGVRGADSLLGGAAIAINVVSIGALLSRLGNQSFDRTFAWKEYTPMPYDLDLIQAAVRQFEELLERVREAAGRLDAFARRWQETIDVSSHNDGLHEFLDEEALDRLALSARSDERNAGLGDQVVDFPNLVFDVVRGRRTVDDVFQELEDSFRPLYDKLQTWDITDVLAKSLNKNVDELDEWAEGLPVAWPISDHDVTSIPLSVSVVSPLECPVGDRNLQPRGCLRVYKFCQGVQLPSATQPFERTVASSKV